MRQSSSSGNDDVDKDDDDETKKPLIPQKNENNFLSKNFPASPFLQDLYVDYKVQELFSSKYTDKKFSIILIYDGTNELSKQAMPDFIMAAAACRSSIDWIRINMYDAPSLLSNPFLNMQHVPFIFAINHNENNKIVPYLGKIHFTLLLEWTTLMITQ